MRRIHSGYFLPPTAWSADSRIVQISAEIKFGVAVMQILRRYFVLPASLSAVLEQFREVLKLNTVLLLCISMSENLYRTELQVFILRYKE